MELHMIKRVLVGSILFLLLFHVPFTMGQAPQTKTSIRNLFAVWAKLSLIGYSQSEIESALQDVDEKVLQKVKHRLRLNVMKNLMRMKLKEEIARGTIQHDWQVVADKIRTEVRFAGLENDRHLRAMIRKHFGISLNQI